jgi:hypothetical protein
VLQQTVMDNGKVTGQIYNLKLPTVLLLVEFNITMALPVLMECDFVSIGVRTVGTKLLTVVSIKIMVF